jgi:hypothetical protein
VVLQALREERKWWLRASSCQQVRDRSAAFYWKLVILQLSGVLDRAVRAKLIDDLASVPRIAHIELSADAQEIGSRILCDFAALSEWYS